MRRASILIIAGIIAATADAAVTKRSEVPQMVTVPAGEFYMGSSDKGADPDELPIRRVRLSRPFEMSRTEVTNAQYEAFRPEHRALRGRDGVSSKDDEPVVNVTYDDAVAYCRWLTENDPDGATYRLPTEAEWEYACRAGTLTRYYTGDWLDQAMRRNQQTVRDYAPVDLSVGITMPNAFGLCDMHGNVEEWCLDWYAPYDPASTVDPTGPSEGTFRVTRGGSHNTPEVYLRSANRSAMLPSDSHSLTGFRVVRAPYPTSLSEQSEPLFIHPVPFVVPPTDSTVPLKSHNHQPALTFTPGGDLIAVWFSADEENSRSIAVLESRLKAGTLTWTPARMFFAVPDRNVTGTSLFTDSAGVIHHINGVEAAGDWQNLAMVHRTSADGGLTWSKPRIIAPRHAKRHQVIAGTVVTPEGVILQACDAGPGGDDGTALHISTDGGETWTDAGGTIAGIHAGVVTLSDGRLMALGRGNNVTDPRTGDLRMPMSLSSDMGRTWQVTPSPFPPISSGQRLVLRRLHSGALLLVSFSEPAMSQSEGMPMVSPDGSIQRCHGMYATLSDDDGVTWSTPVLISDGSGTILDGGAWTGHFIMDSTHAEPRGYLALTQTPDGVVHLISSRLYYRFNEPWLRRR